MTNTLSIVLFLGISANCASAATVELHAADLEEHNGWNEIHDHSGKSVWIAPQAALTQGDIASVELKMMISDNEAAIGISFTQQGAKKNLQFTSQNKGEWIALVVDGVAISTPKVLVPSESSCVVTTHLNKAQAQALISELNGPK